MSSEALTGAAKGAVAGAAVAGPWGAVVGGVIGLVGGIFGDKAKGKKKQAVQVRAQIAEREAAIQRRDIIRSTRVQRAQSVAAGTGDGGVVSSAVMGASSSIGAQGSSSVGFFDTQIGMGRTANAYDIKAARYESYQAMAGTAIGMIGPAMSAGATALSMFRSGQIKPVSITGAASQPSYQFPTGAGATKMTMPTSGNTMQSYGLK